VKYYAEHLTLRHSAKHVGKSVGKFVMQDTFQGVSFASTKCFSSPSGMQ
jgi:hypothetical protein